MIVSQLMDSQPWVLGNRIRNYLALYVIDMTTSLAGMIWVILMIDETKMVDSCEPKEVSVSFANVDEDIPLLKSVSAKNSVSKMAPTFFDFESLKGVVKIIFKKRLDQPRFTLPLIILAHFIITMCKAASRLMLYQFCQMAFNWTMASYSNVTAFFTTLDIVAVIITMPILKRLQVRDLTLCLIGTSSVLLGFLVRGLFITDIGYYIACIANIYMPLSTIASRSLLSSVADKTETGSVFAVTECLDTFAPLLSSILFTQIFNATMSSYIGAALLFGAALSAISLSIYVKLLVDTVFN
ncbi:hypothetical protein HDE_13974 [Halotydeus destructor]|nr:hypothetical protein HDE_13974 [Halotydeus destructor]